MENKEQTVQGKNLKTDPVCGLYVDPKSASHVWSRENEVYYFCSRHCQNAFRRNPEKYLKPKGIVGRYLEKLARENQLRFGLKRPDIHCGHCGEGGCGDCGH